MPGFSVCVGAWDASQITQMTEPRGSRIPLPQISQRAQSGEGAGLDPRDPQTYAIIGAALEVHRTLGHEFLEPVYHEALAVELGARGIPHHREVQMPVYYKGVRLDLHYRVDLVCFGEVLVELKAIDRLTPREESQVINYLAASRMGRGMPLNFGSTSLQYKRFVGPAFLESGPNPAPEESVKSVGGPPPTPGSEKSVKFVGPSE